MRRATCSKDAERADRGGHDRAPADALGPGALGRGARPPEDQVGHARLREDRRPSALPLLRQRDVRRSTSPARSCSSTTTRSSTRPARRRTARSGSRAKSCPGSHAATEFVGWYNGHPDHTDLEVDLLAAERAVVIGNGNVAIDVARMLVLAPCGARADGHRRPRARGARARAASRRSSWSAAAARRRRRSRTPSCSSSASSPTPT